MIARMIRWLLVEVQPSDFTTSGDAGCLLVMLRDLERRGEMRMEVRETMTRHNGEATRGRSAA